MLNFIYNPTAGKGKAQRFRASIEEKLNALGVAHHFWETNCRQDAKRIARELSEHGERDIIAMGGDGTINEVLNGLSDPGKVTLGLIPCGSGNDFAGAMGIPCAYLEGFLKKLTEGELLGQTSGGLYYTRCYIQKMEDHYGDVEAQEAAAKELAEPLWKEIWNTLSGMMEEEEVHAMTDKQRATLLLYFLNRILENCIRRTEETLGVSVHYPGDYPERPNGGRWYATGIVLEEDARQPKYYGSGPVQQGRRNEGYYIWDYQSLFGDAHWAYPGMKYSPDFGAVGRFLVSLVPGGGVTAEDERLYELIPEFEKLHILRRDEDGKAVLDIPALSWEAANRWSVPLKELTERVYRIAGERLEELYRSRKNKVPHHVDKWQMYEHEGALGSYVMALMLAIVKAGLLPYPVEIGKTPVIFLAYTKNGQKG